MMHGCTQSPDDFAAGTRMNELAENRCFWSPIRHRASPPTSQNAELVQRQRPAARYGEPSLIAASRARSCRTSPSTPNASTSQDFLQGRNSAIMDQFTRTYTRPLVFILDWRAALPSTCPPPSPQCGRAGTSVERTAATRQSTTSGADHRLPWRRDKTVHPANGDQVIAQSQAEPSSIARSARANRLAEWPIRAQSRRIRPGSRPRALGAARSRHAWSVEVQRLLYGATRPDASREMLRFFFDHATSRQIQRQEFRVGE